MTAGTPAKRPRKLAASRHEPSTRRGVLHVGWGEIDSGGLVRVVENALSGEAAAAWLETDRN